MNITEDLLTINKFSRPGKALVLIKAVVMHWTANPGVDAKHNRDFFESKKTGMGGYGSAHYIVGQKGEIIHCIPDSEVAYHVGSTQQDPSSGKIYTDYARQKFGWFAKHPDTTSPNWITLGIEMCPVDMEGNFTANTLQAAAELTAHLLQIHCLTVDDVTTHHAIVGWKDCPRLWTVHPELFEDFKQTIKSILVR